MHGRYEAAQPQRHVKLIDFRQGVKLRLRDASKSKGDVVNAAIVSCFTFCFVLFCPSLSNAQHILILEKIQACEKVRVGPGP